MAIDSRSWRKDAALAYALLRFTLGLNICMHGIVRWATGLGRFAGSLTDMFRGSPLPPWITDGFGYMLPVLEAVVGGGILLGFWTQRALTAGMILILLLMLGSSLRQDWQTVGVQLIYSVTYGVLIATESVDRYCLDRFVFRSARDVL
jgi:thiosulfate dehydrogenase (quinone) large subunit